MQNMSPAMRCYVKQGNLASSERNTQSGKSQELSDTHSLRILANLQGQNYTPRPPHHFKFPSRVGGCVCVQEGKRGAHEIPAVWGAHVLHPHSPSLKYALWPELGGVYAILPGKCFH